MGQRRRAQAAVPPCGMQSMQAFDVLIGNMCMPEQLLAQGRTRARVNCLHRARRVVQITQANLPHNPVISVRENNPGP